MNKEQVKNRYNHLIGLNKPNGMPFARPFPEWSKGQQIEFKVLHEILYLDGRTFSRVKLSDGLKYTEAEIEKARREFRQNA